MFGRSGGFFYTGPQTCVLEEFILQGYRPIFFHVPVFLAGCSNHCRGAGGGCLSQPAHPAVSGFLLIMLCNLSPVDFSCVFDLVRATVQEIPNLPVLLSAQGFGFIIQRLNSLNVHTQSNAMWFSMDSLCKLCRGTGRFSSMCPFFWRLRPTFPMNQTCGAIWLREDPAYDPL